MSIELLRQIVIKTIKSQSNDMIAIKGGWGVGKTYFWNETVQKAISQGHMGKSHYSYVTLFGVNSLEELKNTILASRTSSKNTGSPDTVTQWTNKSGS